MEKDGAAERRAAGKRDPVPRLLLGAGIALWLGMLSGCAATFEKTHVAAKDSGAFYPFLRASVILGRGDAKASGAAAPGAPDRRAGPSLRQGNVALDLEAGHVEGRDDDPARQRTFSLNSYALSLRGSTRPDRFGGLYLEGLVGLHRVEMHTESRIGITVDADEFGFLMGIGFGYALTDNATVHVRSVGATAASGAIGMQEILATYWFTPHIGLSGGYRTGEFFNEILVVGFDIKWRGPTAGLVMAF
jgi:hypothetical protein